MKLTKYQKKIINMINSIRCPWCGTSEVKYLLWQQRWYCTHCQDCIGETNDLIEAEKKETKDIN